MSHNLNPVIHQQINELRSSTDSRDRSLATVLEVLLDQSGQLSEIEAQTKKTNGRVSKQECITEDLTARITSIETPLQQVKWIKQILHTTVAALVVFLGLLFTLMATPVWAKLTEPEKEIAPLIEDAVAKAVASQKKQH